MSPDSDPASSGNGNSLDASLNRAIEAMNHLREDLRMEGLTALADALDETVVKCLKLYLDREQAKTGDALPEPRNGSGAKPS